MKKGLTLIEIVLAIALISLIIISFIPGLTFGYKHLIESKKYTEDIFDAQSEIEKKMEEERNNELNSVIFTRPIFGINVEGHSIDISIKNYGRLHVFQPKKEYFYPEPKIIRDINSGISNIIKLSAFNNSTEIPNPKIIEMFTNLNVLNENVNFLIDKKYYKIDNPKIFLVNVYRWYTSSMVQYSEDFSMDNYFIIKEWNAARAPISYEDSKVLKVIPNIQNNPDYNRLSFKEIKDGLNLSNSELINQYGNKYFYFSITPFAVSGKIGKEEFSNSIYIKAPRIEIDKAIYGPSENQVCIYFKTSIQDTFVIDKMSINKDLGNIIGCSRDISNDKVIVLEFDKILNTNIDTGGNILFPGSVLSTLYNDIYIWSPDNIPSGEFVIKNIE